MRPELKVIEQIEQYILNQMNADERTQFEQELSASSELKQQLHIQQQLTIGIQLIGLKRSTQNAYKKYQLTKWLKRGLLILMLGGLSYMTFLWVNNEAPQEEPCVHCEQTESGAEHEDSSERNCCEVEVQEVAIDTSEICEDEIEAAQTTVSDSVVLLDDNTIESAGNIEFDAQGNIVYENPEHKARFKQGKTALNNWIDRNLVYPSEDVLSELVQVKFWVNYDGKVLYPTIIKGKSEANKAAVSTLMSKMPNWIPAEHNGSAVSSYMTLELDFGGKM